MWRKQNKNIIYINPKGNNLKFQEIRNKLVTFMNPLHTQINELTNDHEQLINIS